MIVSFNTIVRQPVVLHDGVILPEGAHIQMATHSIGVDPDQVTDPDVFDGLRHYNNRKRPGEENWHRKWRRINIHPPPCSVLTQAKNSRPRARLTSILAMERLRAQVVSSLIA